MANSSRTGVLPDIHTLWVGEGLGPLERLCLTSWVRQGHRVVLHAYRDLSCPPGVALRDAGLLWPEAGIFRHRRSGSLAVFADVFRAALLASHDAVWADADVFLLRPFDVSDRNVLAREGSAAGAPVNNALMRLHEGHPILREILATAEAPWRAIPHLPLRKSWPMITAAVTGGRLHASDLPWGALGYRILQRHVRRAGFDGLVIGPECSLTAATMPIFTPVPDPDAELAPPVLYVHLYRSQVQVDLARPVPGSIYARLWQLAGLDPAAP